MYCTPFLRQSSISLLRIGRDALDMSVSPRQNFLKPPPVPEMPTVTLMAPRFAFWNSSATASVIGNTVLEPSSLIVCAAPSCAGPSVAVTASANPKLLINCRLFMHSPVSGAWKCPAPMIEKADDGFVTDQTIATVVARGQSACRRRSAAGSVGKVPVSPGARRSRAPPRGQWATARSSRSISGCESEVVATGDQQFRCHAACAAAAVGSGSIELRIQAALRHLRRPQQCPRLALRLLPFGGGLGVGDDASARLDVQLPVLDDRGAQRDGHVHVAVKAQVADRARVDAALHRLQLVDDLHRAHLGR